VILEGGSAPGTFFRTFPRHRTLISINKVYTGANDPELKLRMDWNSLLSDDDELHFTRYSSRYFPPADEMVRYLGDFAAKHRLPIRCGSRVVSITRGGKDEPFLATDQRGRIYQARRLIVATGVSRPYIPPIPGIETAELYGTVSTDPRDFVDQRVLILGKANSAFETADNLIATAAVIHVAGPHSIKMAWRTHYVGHLRAVNNNFLDTYQLKSQNAVLDGTVDRIERGEDGSYTVTVSFARVNEVKKDMRYDRVIVCTGFQFDASIFEGDCRPQLVHGDRLVAPEALAEVVALEEPRHRVARSEPDHALRAELVGPLGVEENLRAAGVEDLEHLVAVGLRVGEDLLAREPRPRLVLPCRVADHAGKVADQELDLVAELLEVAQLVDHHRVAQMEVRGGGIEAELHPQLAAARELFRELLLDD